MPFPPPPPFWPEKATEWIALVGGAIGGLLAPFAFIISILNYRRDVAKLRVKFSGRKPYLVAIPPYDPNVEYYFIRAVNYGRRPVQILRADGHFYRGGGFHIAGSSGSVLSEQNPETVIPFEAAGVDLDSIWYFSVTSGGDHETRCYVSSRWTRFRKALQHWPDRRKLRAKLQARDKEPRVVLSGIQKETPAEAKPERLTVRETKAQLMQRIGPLLAAVADVLDHVHHFRQRFTNTFDHHNVLQRKPDSPLYAPLEAVAGIASTVSIKTHKHVAVAIERLKILDRLQQQVGSTLKNSVGRGLTGAAAEEVKKQADQECNHLEFYSRPVREELERMIADSRLRLIHTRRSTAPVIKDPY